MTATAFSLPAANRRVSGRLVSISLVTLLLAGVVLRVWLAVHGHSIRHPDEIFQTLEQSHRLVFGYGIVPWEFREGIRWLGTPIILTPPMGLAKLLGLSADFYVPVTRASLAIFSLIPVPFFYVLVSRRNGKILAVIACLLPVMWVEHLDFSGSTLSDAVAAPLISMAVIGALLSDRASKGAVAALAALMVFTFCVRFHLGPALLLAAITAVLKMTPANRPTFFVSLALSGLVLGALDLLVGQMPFQHVYLNLYRNIVDGVAAGFGEEEWFYYFEQIWERWQWGLLIPLVAIFISWRSTWLLFASAIIVIASFSLIAHKEYRFYYPSTMLFTFAAGWAIAECARLLSRRKESPGLAGALVSFVALFATAFPSQARYVSVFNEHEDPRIAAEMYVGRTADVCGLGFDFGMVITGSAGLVHINKPIGFDVLDVKNADDESLSRFNYLLIDKSKGSAPSPYVELQCWEDLCLYRRPGDCTASSIPEVPGP